MNTARLAGRLSARRRARVASLTHSQRWWVRGVTALEFALVAPLAILVLFFSIEMGIMTWADATLEVAASRISRTGQLGVFAKEDCTVAVRRLFEESMAGWVGNKKSLRVDVLVYTPGAANQLPDVDDEKYEPECNAGDRGDMVMYRLGFDRPGFSGILSWLGIRLLRFERTVIIQNEP
ncbi:pilus assembly protein [Alcaligenaceae bacterium]|nr:pilus assembly protein [Alcaligenaceae bacterium]